VLRKANEAVPTKEWKREEDKSYFHTVEGAMTGVGGGENKGFEMEDRHMKKLESL